MLRSVQKERHVSGFVEVLTTQISGEVFGYRFVGHAAGPQVAVIGACASAGQAFDRLLSIPTLPWMRGNLVLIRADVLECIVGDLSSLTQVGAVDRTMILPWTNLEQADPVLVRRYYRDVLRACARLGMISGRGVYEPFSDGAVS